MKLTLMAVSESMFIKATVRYRALKFVTCLEYEYTQVTVDLFYENDIFNIHCLLMVYNNIPSFLVS